MSIHCSFLYLIPFFFSLRIQKSYLNQLFLSFHIQNIILIHYPIRSISMYKNLTSIHCSFLFTYDFLFISMFLSFFIHKSDLNQLFLSFHKQKSYLNQLFLSFQIQKSYLNQLFLTFHTQKYYLNPLFRFFHIQKQHKPIVLMYTN